MTGQHPPDRREGRMANAVLDPAWEDELRLGQRADGEIGSVEAELAIVHLFRHARAPEALGDERRDRLWTSISSELTPRRWWRRSWLLWGGPLVAAAAAVVIVVLLPRGTDGPEMVARSELESASHGLGAVLENQFALLEPEARRAVAVAVDRRRERVRGDLLTSVIGPDQGSAGGAP